jgi:hypothetical protein
MDWWSKGLYLRVYPDKAVLEDSVAFGDGELSPWQCRILVFGLETGG